MKRTLSFLVWIFLYLCFFGRLAKLTHYQSLDPLVFFPSLLYRPLTSKLVFRRSYGSQVKCNKRNEVALGEVWKHDIISDYVSLSGTPFYLLLPGVGKLPYTWQSVRERWFTSYVLRLRMTPQVQVGKISHWWPWYSSVDTNGPPLFLLSLWSYSYTGVVRTTRLILETVCK